SQYGDNKESLLTAITGLEDKGQQADFLDNIKYVSFGSNAEYETACKKMTDNVFQSLSTMNIESVVKNTMNQCFGSQEAQRARTQDLLVPPPSYAETIGGEKGPRTDDPV